MLVMERSEPSLIPEWLRSTGGGTGGGNSRHHFAVSQAEGPVLARSRSSRSISNTDSLHSAVLDRSSSSNSRRSSNSNGFSKHDKNSYSRSYSSFSRHQRDRDRERLMIADNWDSEYSDPLRGMINGTADPLRRTRSMISRRQGEVPQRRIPTDLRNGSYKNLNNGNGVHSVVSSVPSVQKMSFERDFPVLSVEERPKTPDVDRIASPGLSRGIQNLSIGSPLSVVSEAWTSALAELHTGTGCNIAVGSSPALLSSSAVSTSSSVLGPVVGSNSSGLNMAEALVQPPALLQNVQPSVQSQREELALAQSKKLIPMMPVLPKTLAFSSSDKLKPKTAMRSSETAATPKNGLHHLSPLQLGSQPLRGTSARVDGPKSPSSGKLLLLKPGRENGFSSGLKDLQSQTANSHNKVDSGLATDPPSAASAPTKTLNNPKVLPNERTTSASLNSGTVVNRRISRNNFFKRMREKSLNNTSVTAESEASASSGVCNSDKEAQELSSTEVIAEVGTETNLNGETCIVADIFSHLFPNEKEREFLLSLGWEPEDDNTGAEEGLTEEEIRAFKDELMKLRPTTPRLSRVLQS